jgi:hypothetical protein
MNRLTAVRSTLLALGRRATPGLLDNLRSVLSYLEVGREFPVPAMLPNEFALFGVALNRITGERPLYLEFGVFEGRTMRWWVQHLTAPGARLVGFDSFEGLPQRWHTLDKGHFATSGIPVIDDDRVSFQVGWFENTLPDFRVPEHDQLIINVDCDLYSSAATVLAWAQPYLKPGTLVYFDEFPDRDHELRAFRELCTGSSVVLRPVAVASGGKCWLFEVA